MRYISIIGPGLVRGPNRSDTLTAVRFVQGNVEPVHAAMRSAAGSRNLRVVGGGDLAGQFYDGGLLDELIVQIGSATLGRGKPLLPRQILSPLLRLKSAQMLGAGMAELRYDVQRDPIPGDPG